MALAITSHCIGCDACKIVCPTQAIVRTEQQLSIGRRCDECSQLKAPQCASICPVENAIVNSNGNALNPSGSLVPLHATLSEILQRQEDIL